MLVQAIGGMGIGRGGHGYGWSAMIIRIASLHIAMQCFGGYCYHTTQQALVLLINDDDTVVL